MKHVVLLKSRSNCHGGLEKYASRIADAFIQQNAKVTILTTGETPQQSNIPIYTKKTIPWPAFVRMEQFDRFVKKWISKHPVDLIFGMDRNRFQTHIRAGNGVHAAYLKSRTFTEGKKKAFFCQINPLHRKILELEKAAFENPQLQKLFTNSQMVKEQILQYYHTDPSKIQVIHNGVEWFEMSSNFQKWQEAKEFLLPQNNLKKDHFHFLFIGHGYLRKGLEKLLIALSLLKSKHFHLSVVGKENQIEFFKATVDRLGLKNQVRFFGPTQKISSFYQFADCLVIPSFYDPFANVTVEALAMGLFVVSSKQNGGHEILNQNNGVVIEDLLDPYSIAQALEVAMQHPKTKISAQNLRNSVKHLDFSNQLKTLVESCG